MTRHIFATCGAVALAGCMIAAQTPTTTTPPRPGSQPGQATTPSDTKPAGQTVTYTGCIGAWNGSLSTASGSSASSTPSSASTSPSSSSNAGMTGSSGQFMLSNPQIYTSGTSSSGSTADSAVSGSVSGSPAASGYLLQPSGSSVNFNQYLNRRVRVTGVLENGSPSATTSSSPGSSTSPSSTGQSGQSVVQTFTVTSIQAAAGSCP